MAEGQVTVSGQLLATGGDGSFGSLYGIDGFSGPGSNGASFDVGSNGSAGAHGVAIASDSETNPNLAGAAGGAGGQATSSSVSAGTGGSYNLAVVAPVRSISGFTVTSAAVTPSASGVGFTADVNVPGLGSLTSVNLAGIIQSDGDYDLTATLPNVTLSNSGLDLAGNTSLPLVGNVALAGTIQGANNYSLSDNLPNFSLGGFSLTGAVVTLSNSGIGLVGNTSLPLVGSVALAGTIQDASNYSLSAGLTNFSVGGYSLSGAVATLSDNGVELSGSANLPLVGSVPLTGTILDGSHYSLTDSLPNVSIGGFALTNADIILSDGGLRFLGDATLPVIGTIQHLQGSIQGASNFSLSAPLSSVTVGNFMLSNNTVTLMAAGGAVSLTLSGNATLPVFSTVTFAGTITSDGSFTITASPQPFSLPWGIVQFTNETLTLSSASDSISVAAVATVAQIGQADFSGSISADGSYSLTATASINVAGFSIKGATLALGSNELGVDFDLAVPDIGNVSFGGSYGPGGQWSLTGTYDPIVPVQIGPLSLYGFSFTLTNTSLTLGCMGTVVDLQDLVNAQVTAQIFYDGRFEATIDVHALQVSSFSLGQATVTFGNDNPSHEFILTVNAIVAIPGLEDVSLNGTLDANGSYNFKGKQDLILGGLTLSQAQFDLNNTAGPASFNFSAGCDFGVFTATVSGTIATTTAGGFVLTADATGSILGAANLDLSGYIDSHGNYKFTGQANVNVGPLDLTQASFTLSNTSGFTFSATWDYLVFSGNVAVTIDSNSLDVTNATLSVPKTGLGQIQGTHINVHVPRQIVTAGGDIARHGERYSTLSSTSGFTFSDSWNYLVFSGNVAVTITSNSQGYVLDLTNATLSVPGISFTMSGDVSASSYDLTGHVNVNVGPLDLTQASFTLSSTSGFTFSDSWNYLVFSGNVAVTITSNSQGYVLDVTNATLSAPGLSFTISGDVSASSYDLTGHVNVNVGPLQLSQASVTLSNTSGFTFTAIWNFDIFAGSVAATITGNDQGYNVYVDASGKVLGQVLTTDIMGNLSSSGSFDLRGKAAVNLGPIQLASATFDISNQNQTGTTKFTFGAAWTFGVFSSASMTATITGNNQN